MSIRLKVWLGAMACATLLVTAFGALATVLGSWIIAGLIALIVFAPLAWWLAWLAYHPVRDVARTSRSITTTGQLDRRCFYAGPRDDVGDLVVSVNELLVRYDAAIGRLRRLQAESPTCDCPRAEPSPDPADLVVMELMARDEPPGASRPGTGVSRPGS